jgi:hypothetical protein
VIKNRERIDEDNHFLGVMYLLSLLTRVIDNFKHITEMKLLAKLLTIASGLLGQAYANTFLVDTKMQSNVLAYPSESILQLLAGYCMQVLINHTTFLGRPTANSPFLKDYTHTREELLTSGIFTILLGKYFSPHSHNRLAVDLLVGSMYVSQNIWIA